MLRMIKQGTYYNNNYIWKNTFFEFGFDLIDNSPIILKETKYCDYHDNYKTETIQELYNIKCKEIK